MQSKSIKVLSYNIHKGFGLSRFNLHRMRAEMRSISPDIVLLQEVQGQHDRLKKKHREWPENSQTEFLADAIWSHHRYGKNAIYEQGHHGNAILSKFPIFFSENIEISTNRLEKRGMLHATVHWPDQDTPLQLYCTHLNLLEAGRKKQLKEIIYNICKSGTGQEPLILAGDFNDWRERAHHVLESELNLTDAYATLKIRSAKTFPSTWPLLRLDRIYSRGLTVKKVTLLSHAPWNELSDHLPILAEFEHCCARNVIG